MRRKTQHKKKGRKARDDFPLSACKTIPSRQITIGWRRTQIADYGRGRFEDNDIAGNAGAGVEIASGGDPVLVRVCSTEGRK